MPSHSRLDQFFTGSQSEHGKVYDIQDPGRFYDMAPGNRRGQTVLQHSLVAAKTNTYPTRFIQIFTHHAHLALENPIKIIVYIYIYM